MKEIKVKTVNVSLDELQDLFKQQADEIHQFYTERDQRHIAELREQLYVFKEWLTADEAAKMLNNVKPDTVKFHYTNKGLKFKKVGNNFFFHKDDINEFIANGKSRKAA